MDLFDPKALYDALDATRTNRGLSWMQVASQTGVSGTTLSHLVDGGPKELDGVRAMIRWLGSTTYNCDDLVGSIRAVSSLLRARQLEFTSGQEVALDYLVRVSHSNGRFDNKALYAALNERRTERKMPWTQVGYEVGLAPAMLTHTRKGGRIEVNRMLAMVA